MGVDSEESSLVRDRGIVVNFNTGHGGTTTFCVIDIYIQDSGEEGTAIGEDFHRLCRHRAADGCSFSMCAD